MQFLTSALANPVMFYTLLWNGMPCKFSLEKKNSATKNYQSLHPLILPIINVGSYDIKRLQEDAALVTEPGASIFSTQGWLFLHGI